MRAGAAESPEASKFSVHERRALNCSDQPRCDVLIVDNLSFQEQQALPEGLRGVQGPDDKFVYKVLVVHSIDDALNAVLDDPEVQACVIRYKLTGQSDYDSDALVRNVAGLTQMALANQPEVEPSLLLGRVIKELRPEIDQFLVTGHNEQITPKQETRHVHRVFDNDTAYIEQHNAILQAIDRRFDAPLFAALREYSHKSIESFHALPIAQGRSLLGSQWMAELVDFFGTNVFMAESSATSGGLDSLHRPRGPIRQATQYAARAFGAQESFFVTNAHRRPTRS